MNPVVLIPARNEAATIAQVVAGCRLHVSRVVVVCDACTDATGSQARGAGAEVWVHPGRPGKAAALRWAWEHLAADPGWTHVVLLDGDGQHEPGDLPALLQEARKGGLVLGSRAPFRPPMPFLRRGVNRFMSAVVSRMTGIRVLDSQCGFRVLPRRLVVAAGWTSRCFELESETVLRAVRMGLRVDSIPVHCGYGSGFRPSHICPWIDTLRWLFWIGRHGFLLHHSPRS